MHVPISNRSATSFPVKRTVSHGVIGFLICKQVYKRFKEKYRTELTAWYLIYFCGPNLNAEFTVSVCRASALTFFTAECAEECTNLRIATVVKAQSYAER